MRPAPLGCAWRSPTPTGSRTPPSCLGGEGKGGGERGKGGAAPPFLVLFGLGGGGAPLALAGPSLSPLGPIKAHYFPGGGVPVTLRYSGFSPKTPGTLLVSEYSHPMYQSLCLDHFETPRHVRDHIRDSEQPSVHQNL